jgi:hypothetical protein
MTRSVLEPSLDGLGQERDRGGNQVARPNL